MRLSGQEKDNQTLFMARVIPRSSQDQITGIREGILQIRVKAAPTGGRANEACRKLVAQELGVPPSTVTLQGGFSARTKRLAVEGLGMREVESRFHQLISPEDAGCGRKRKRRQGAGRKRPSTRESEEGPASPSPR